MRSLLCCLVCAINLLAADSLRIQHTLFNLYTALDELYASLDPITYELKQLREHPADISYRNYQFSQELANILETYKKTYQSSLYTQKTSFEAQQEAYNLVIQRTKNNPLICFFECNSEICALSRQNNPSARDTYEHRVAERIANTQPTDGSPVVYTSFGTGWLLSDLRILSLALERHPTMQIHIHCIDPVFSDIDSPIQMITNQSIDVSHVQENVELKDFPQKYNIAQYSSIRSAPAPKHYYTYHTKPGAQPEYMLYVLRHAYPNARITLHLYTDPNEYYKFVYGSRHIHKPGRLLYLPPPHIISCCDIHSESFQDIANTIHEILRISSQDRIPDVAARNPRAIYLMGFDKQPVILAEASLEPFQGSERYAVNDLRSLMSGASVTPLSKKLWEDHASSYVKVDKLADPLNS